MISIVRARSGGIGFGMGNTSYAIILSVKLIIGRGLQRAEKRENILRAVPTTAPGVACEIFRVARTRFCTFGS